MTIPFLVIFIFLFSSCTADKFAKDKLCSNLYMPYTAKADFVISNGENNTIGKADISKSETITMAITEPEGYNGINIMSDNTGNSDIISFEFSGIPADIPKTASGSLSLMFSLFSDDIPSKIASLGKDSFRFLNNNSTYCEVFFTENGTNYKITYDSKNGYPYMLDAGNDEMSVNIVLTDFSIIQQE